MKEKVIVKNWGTKVEERVFTSRQERNDFLSNFAWAHGIKWGENLGWRYEISEA